MSDCYGKKGASGPCCRDQRNNVLYLARIECGLKDAYTREKFIEYLKEKGNNDKILLIRAYVVLTDKITQKIKEELPFLIPNSKDVQNLEKIDLSTAQETEVNTLRESLMNEIVKKLNKIFGKFAEKHKEVSSSK